MLDNCGAADKILFQQEIVITVPFPGIIFDFEVQYLKFLINGTTFIQRRMTKKKELIW